MRTNYILIDYENVQPSALSVLEKEHFKVIVFIGASQTKVNFEVAEHLQRFGANASYVKIAGNGPNALDFHIAYYIGQLSASDPTAYFHIISKDTGFDPLITHLKSRKIFSCRSSDIGEIPIVQADGSKTVPEKIAAIVADLKRRGNSKPRTVATLSSTINALFLKSLQGEEVASLVKFLQQHKFISITDTKVTYSLPE